MQSSCLSKQKSIELQFRAFLWQKISLVKFHHVCDTLLRVMRREKLFYHYVLMWVDSTVCVGLYYQVSSSFSC